MLYYSTHKRFHLFYCNAGIIVCHFVCNLMAFVCQEIKGLLTYILTYLLTFVHFESFTKLFLSVVKIIIYQVY